MKQLIRALITAISALLLVSITLAAMPAQAAEPTNTRSSVVATTDTAVNLTSARRKVDVDAGWTGWNIKFNRTETRGIAAGAGSCSVIVGKLPSVPSKVLSAGCGLLTVYAGYVLSGGNCLRVSVTYWGQPSFGSWNC